MINMPRVNSYAHAVNTYLARHNPPVYSALRLLNVDSRIYLIEWWMTAFSSVLSLDTASRVWDALIVEGLAALVQVLA